MNKLIIITGAAQGLGKAICLQFLAQGDHVIAVDSDPQTLQALPDTNVTKVLINLMDTNDYPRLAQSLGGQRADVLIHCAGISATGKFEDIPAQNHHDVIAVNLTAPMSLTAFLLKQNALSERANITLVSSLSHFLGYPGASSYAASKDGLAHYGQSLQKAYPTMRVLRVFPGPIDTEHAKRYAPDNSQKSMANRISADQAAASVLHAIHRNHKTCIPSLPARVGAIAGRIAPRLMGRILRRSLLDKMDKVRI